jgi:glycosyltransferase involved in cell wall biosynthesis
MQQHVISEIEYQPSTVKGDYSWPFSISVIIPAYQESQTIRQVVMGVSKVLPSAEVIVIIDGVDEDTAKQAELAGANVIRHPYNIGNGAAVKTGFRHATGDVILVIDADGQHDPADIPKILLPLEQGHMMVVGARSKDSQASLFRGLGNELLNRFASYVTSHEILDLTSGFRAMRRNQMLEFIHLLPNQYSWPTTSLLAFIKAGYPVLFIPIVAHRRQGGHSRQKLFRNGLRFSIIVLRITMLFSPLRVFIPVSVFFLFVSVCFYILSVLVGGVWLHLPPASVAFFINAVLIFMLGLISEQIAALRFGISAMLE